MKRVSEQIASLAFREPWRGGPAFLIRRKEPDVYQQHVIDWYRHRGYHVTVLSDFSFMAVSSYAEMQTDSDAMSDAIRRLYAARLKTPRGSWCGPRFNHAD